MIKVQDFCVTPLNCFP